jgi:hypothetical protein
MQQEVTPGGRSRDADALRAAFGREGCPVCTVTFEHLELLVDSWEYEGFSDVEHRHELIGSRGFCPLHTWHLAQRSNAFRLGLIYSEVLADVVQELQHQYNRLALADGAVSKRVSILHGWWRRWRHRSHEQPVRLACPLCRSRSIVEQRLIWTLVQQLHAEEIRTLLCQSTGLCLVHFAQARQQAEADDPPVLRHLLACQLTCTQRVLSEVCELVRKHDYRFSDEPRGNEMTSWRRAAQLCAGNRGVR